MRACLAGFLASVCLLSGNIPAADAVVYKASAVGSETWLYAGRFCFAPTGGLIQMTLTFPTTAHLSVIHYPLRLGAVNGVQLTGWNEVYQSSFSCTERMQKGLDFNVHSYTNNSRAIKPIRKYLSPGSYINYTDDHAESSIVDGNHVITRNEPLTFSEKQWLFFALANCDLDCTAASPSGAVYGCEGPVAADYTFTFTNGDTVWNKHWSADERGILELNLAFFVGLAALCAYAALVRRRLLAEDHFHQTVQLLMAAAACQLASLGFHLAHNARFASDGVGVEALQVVGSAFNGASDTLLIIQMVLICKGWTICVRKLTARGRIMIAVYSSVYAYTYGMALLVYHTFSDPATLPYLYLSSAGWAICCLRVACVAWVQYATRVTVRKFRAKVHFFRKYSWGVSLWLAVLPVVTLAMALAEAEVRAVLIFGVEYGAKLALLTLIMLMYDPRLKRFNKSFPFHARTAEMADPVAKRAGAAPAARGQDPEEGPGGAVRRAGLASAARAEAGGEGGGGWGVGRPDPAVVEGKQTIFGIGTTAQMLKSHLDRLMAIIEALEDDVADPEADDNEDEPENVLLDAEDDGGHIIPASELPAPRVMQAQAGTKPMWPLTGGRFVTSGPR